MEKDYLYESPKETEQIIDIVKYIIEINFSATKSHLDFVIKFLKTIRNILFIAVTILFILTPNRSYFTKYYIGLIIVFYIILPLINQYRKFEYDMHFNSVKYTVLYYILQDSKYYNEIKEDWERTQFYRKACNIMQCDIDHFINFIKTRYNEE